MILWDYALDLSYAAMHVVVGAQASLPASAPAQPSPYRFLRGLGGRTDEQWALMAICLAIAASAISGALSRRTRNATLVWSLFLGLGVGALSDTLVYEGSACGVLGIPLLCAVAAVLGRLGRDVGR